MSLCVPNSHQLVSSTGVEAEIPYSDNNLWTLAVSGGDIAIQRWSKSAGAKVDVFNGPVLDGEEVGIKTQSSTNVLYMTPTTDVTYIDFVKE